LSDTFVFQDVFAISYTPKEFLGVESCDVGILGIENFAQYFSEKYGGLIFGERGRGGGGPVCYTV